MQTIWVKKKSEVWNNSYSDYSMNLERIIFLLYFKETYPFIRQLAIGLIPI